MTSHIQSQQDFDGRGGLLWGTQIARSGHRRWVALSVVPSNSSSKRVRKAGRDMTTNDSCYGATIFAVSLSFQREKTVFDVLSA